MIKEGFQVKGINLTVQEIQGGNIDISGDLNVSAGITEIKSFSPGQYPCKIHQQVKDNGIRRFNGSKRNH